MTTQQIAIDGKKQTSPSRVHPVGLVFVTLVVTIGIAAASLSIDHDWPRLPYRLGVSAQNEVAKDMAYHIQSKNEEAHGQSKDAEKRVQPEPGLRMLSYLWRAAYLAGKAIFLSIIVSALCAAVYALLVEYIVGDRKVGNLFHLIMRDILTAFFFVSWAVGITSQAYQSMGWRYAGIMGGVHLLIFSRVLWKSFCRFR